MSDGWFRVRRGWRDSPIFRGEFDRASAWLWLIEAACWRPTKFDIRGKTVTLERGQLCATREQLAAAWRWSSSGVERFLTRLETEQMIERQTGQGKTVITLCNYAKYQDVAEPNRTAIGQPTGQQSDSNRTAKEEGKKERREEGEEANASPPSARARRKRQVGVDQPLPADWEPTLGPKAQEIVSGWPEGMFERELFAFRSHAEATGRMVKSWDAAFGTWISKTEGRRQDDRSKEARRASAPRRDNRDGFTAALDRRLGLGEPAGEAGRYDPGEGAGDRVIPIARARLL